MPRSRVEIQKDINTCRYSIECDDDAERREGTSLELKGLERELAEVKARGEKGRSLEEIREEISETQSKVNDYRSILNSATDPTRIAMCKMSARVLQCEVNALNLELKEAIKENTEKEKAEIEKIQQMFEQEISSNPNSAEVYIKRGYVFAANSLDEGNQIFLDHAIADFTKAINLDPNAVDAYSSRAGLYSQNGDHDRAIADYDHMIQIDPNNAEAYAFRGAVYSQEGKYDQALADFNRAIRLNPKCKNAYAFRGMMYFEYEALKKENADYDKAVASVDKAIADIEAALKLDPGDAAAAAILKKVRNEKEVVGRMRRERQEQYDRLVQEMNKVLTEEEYRDFAQQLKAMKGYKNSVELANKCDNRYQELRKEREAREAEERAIEKKAREEREAAEQREREVAEQKAREKNRAKKSFIIFLAVAPIVTAFILYSMAGKAIGFFIFLLPSLMLLHFRKSIDRKMGMDGLVAAISTVAIIIAGIILAVMGGYWGSLVIVLALITGYIFPLGNIDRWVY